MTSLPAVYGQQQRALQQQGLEDVLGLFLSSLDVSLATKSTYSRTLKQFLLWLQEAGKTALLQRHELQPEDILQYKEALLAEGKSAYSVSSYLTSVRRFFSWLEVKGLHTNVAREVKGAKKPKGFRKDTLTPEQLRSALDGIDRSTLEGLRDYAMFNLMARTALRTVEVSRATVGDLRQEGGRAILWVTGKGRSAADEFVLLTEETLVPIREWLSLRRAAFGPLQDEEPLFCSLSNNNQGGQITTRYISGVVKRALRAIGLDSKRLTAHSLRHTAITLARLGGASLEATQAMARHSKIETTQQYDHMINRLQGAAEQFIQF